MPADSFAYRPMSWKPNRSMLKRPFYLSIARLLEQDIVNGFLAPGVKLPPQRELAGFLDINFTTITRAYSLCAQKGLLYAVTGSGTFVSPRADCTAAPSAGAAAGACIELGHTASFEPCCSTVERAARSVMGKSYLKRLLLPPGSTGIPHQKMAGLNWLEQFGVRAGTEQIVMAAGAQNALAAALSSLFTPGDRIAADVYTDSNFIALSKRLHLQPVPIPGDRSGMLPDELEKQCRLNGIRGIFLMPSCCNPTTVLISDVRKKELAQVIRKHGLFVLEDDRYAFLAAGTVADCRSPLLALLPEQTVYIGGVSQALCPGLRVAYLVCGGGIREKVEKAVAEIGGSPSSLEGEIVTDLILSGRANEIVREKKRLALAANNLFAACFPQAPRAGNPLSFFRWLPVKAGRNGAELEKDLLQKGLRVYHSDRFLCGAKTARPFLRVSLSSAASFEELKTGLERLKAQLLK